MTEFLSNDPAKALVRVKEKLYDRLDKLSECISSDGPTDRLETHFHNEVAFLNDILDLIEE
ncbi:hypothetical protein EB001_23785 [bacterium]|nr:hypothetical protein [bacterium]